MMLKDIYRRVAKKFWIRPWLYIAKYDKSLNASNKFFYIRVTQGAVDKYNTDEMALLLGHELAHYNKNVRNKDNHEKEFAADSLGMQYLIAAGFDPKKAIGKFDKTPQRESATHPHPQKRKERLLNEQQIFLRS